MASAISLSSIPVPGVAVRQRRSAEAATRTRRVRTWLLSRNAGGASIGDCSLWAPAHGGELVHADPDPDLGFATYAVQLKVGLGSGRWSMRSRCRSRGVCLATAKSGGTEGDEGKRHRLRFLHRFHANRATYVPSPEEVRDAKTGEKERGKHNVYHGVQEGETLESIARQFDIRQEFLVEVNDIPDPTKLSPGEVLWIPHVYEVKRGDTIESIGDKLGVPASKVQAINGIRDTDRDTDSISEGDVLVIPSTKHESKGAAEGRESGRGESRGEGLGVEEGREGEGRTGMGGSTASTTGTTGTTTGHGEGGGERTSTTGTTGRGTTQQGGGAGGAGGGTTKGGRGNGGQGEVGSAGQGGVGEGGSGEAGRSTSSTTGTTGRGSSLSTGGRVSTGQGGATGLGGREEGWVSPTATPGLDRGMGRGGEEGAAGLGRGQASSAELDLGPGGVLLDLGPGGDSDQGEEGASTI
ncbi:hypothetical protein CBR_g41669 [Chara braunii]|uniref:LysM domain-containing protein n=1 Tax=Chara braunii TaxID=69332 RepID=A0A388LWF9_CHABU|nr:hypothetical protein CBR_g41669 [Chara braunii]|eukprot:GBG86605.1 hypothetical protein CBR_g41669 [Chara braunii]